jgi:hypothetical protein
MSENELNFLKSYNTNQEQKNSTLNSNKNIKQNHYNNNSNFDISLDSASKNILTKKSERVDKSSEFYRSKYQYDSS